MSSIGILETSLTSHPRTTNVLSEHIEAKTETRHTFVNGSQIVVFFWIYYRHETRVYCAK
ncbi:hypothetical protein AH448_04425 [Salmonella enterica subsp. diarizonae]|uniref:Uncharacterized protein n=1 Tax=Salmonella enterica I TaxID=59201 RepID=A0A658B128_SALET|nr:hypothetical protein [Salmonella enterica]EAW1822844.1 hypothetical protein [Salmonella enterica subsp. diarizonae]EBP3857493.1 hypothetical protein [Salmonella enterica subsp. enterica]EDT6982235.1 hypothetical protein [Salmonella enterica subsp. arizonae]PUU60921.1 hypothetical protein BUJ13_005075 [Salmonella enterica subsp. diarizonae serovar 60:r:e,n,x,z15]